MKKRLLSLLLAFAMAVSLLPAAAFAGADDTVYISAAHDGRYLDGLAYVPVSLDELKKIDLNSYGLSDFSYDADGDGTSEITALHLVIYAHTVLQHNDWDDVRVSGESGSIFFESGLFGFADCNMNYYVNGEYPAIDGWGVTMDQCVLTPGDFVDFAAYSSWSFYGDSAAGFHYFMDGSQITHDYEAVTGKTLAIKLGRTTGGMGGATLLNEEPGYTVSYSKTLYANDADTVTTNDSGTAEITFSETGAYYLWVDGAYGNEDSSSIVSSPAYAKVTVTAPACDHRWTDATCKAPKTCSACGATDGAADPDAHNWVDGICSLCDEECPHASYENGECTVCGKAEPVTVYTVTLPQGEGYAVNGETSVTEGEDYTFTVTVSEGYDGTNMVVKVNDTQVTGSDGSYTAESVADHLTITVSGVVPVEEERDDPVPFSAEIQLPANGNSSWGYVSKLVLSGTDGSLYEAYWSAESNPFVLDVILGQDTAKNAVITATFTTGSGMRPMYAPTIEGDTTVTLEDGKGTINVTAKSWNTALYPNTTWTINLTVDDGSADMRPTYAVTLPTETVGYTVTAYNSESPVIEGRKFSFKVTIDSEYKKGENYKVLVNGEEQTSTSDIYTITNITEPQTVTVEGVEQKTLADKSVTIIAPAGSVISSGKFYSYFKYDFNQPLEKTTLADGRLSYVFPPVPASQGQGFLRIGHPKGVTYWDFDNGLSAGSVYEITEEMLFIGSDDFTKETVYADFEHNLKDKADLYLTVNPQGWLDMRAGDTHSLSVFRNFPSLGNSITNTSVALPDVEYTVIPVNGATGVVTVTPDADNSSFARIKAEKDGTAIILVTYDAVFNQDGEGGGRWSAIWPENTGVIVVTVGDGQTDIQTNMTVNEEANAGGKQILDAEHDILFYVGNGGASYSFRPEEGCSVTVNRASVTEGALSFGGFTESGVTVAADGTVTVTGLTTGSHIIKVEKNGKAAYQVIRARKVSYELKHSDGTAVSAGSPAQPGEKITVQFHNLISPLEKLSGIYNANFGFYYNGQDGDAIRTSGGTYGVYNFSSNESAQKFTFTVPSYWNEDTYTLTDGGIKLGGFGGSFGAHRAKSYLEGVEVNTNASGTGGVASVLPDIVVPVEPTGVKVYYVTLPEGEGYTVTPMGDSTSPVAEGGSYGFTVSVLGGYDGNGLTVKVNGEAVTLTDGSYTVENVTTDLTITVEGVSKIDVETPAETTVVYTNGVDGSNWTDPSVYVDTVAIGGAGVTVESYSWEDNVCTVTLAEDTPVNASVVFTMTIGGSVPNWFNSAALNGTAMSPESPCAVTLVDGKATAELSVTARGKTAAKTFIFTGAKGEANKPAPTWQEIMAKTRAWLTAQAEEKAPAVGSTKGEWQVLGLARDGVSGSFYEDYFAAAKAYIAANADANGKLHASKSTDNSRLILALTALGKDVTDVDGHNLLSGLSDLDYVKKQGINGAVFALIALDSHDYAPAATATATREALINFILSKELPSGGWALSGQAPDDMTPMAVQALAPYYDTDAAVKAAVDKALTVMETMTATTETYAQIIVARSALGLDSADAMDKILAFALEDGSFEKASGSGANQMSTEQAFYAMVAYSRYLADKNTLYDMTDVTIQPQQPASAEAVKTAMEALEVEQADKATYIAIQNALTAYGKLTREEKTVIADTYEAFLDKEEDFEDLLKDAIDDAKLDLEDLYEELDSEDYTEDSWDKIRVLYRDCREALTEVRYAEELGELLALFKEDVENILTGALEVTFRLIGDWQHEDGVSDHEEYVTWIQTTEYTLPAESTVYDLLLAALEEYDLSQKGASKNYVESIQAPDVLGGYWLGEFDNGPNSGWMYTINGDHSGTGLKDHRLEDGDEVIWHYVDDFTLEQRKPSSKYYERWLEADDITPETYIKRNLNNIVTVEGKGEVKPDLKTSHIGKDVKFTFTPAEGWRIKAVYVDGKDKGAIETFTYKGLAMDARIEVVFAQNAAFRMDFVDVPQSEWFYEDVHFAVSRGLFNGLDEDIFAPDASMTRAMLVTVLYRLEGQPAVIGGSSFADVTAGQWYTDAVIWATRKGIVNGLGNGKFGVDDNITREQMAAILYRYAQNCGYDTAARAYLSGYSDAAKISTYAKEAMAWANAMGLINGRTATVLAPDGTATRAEVAAIFHRFVENIAE